jgi:alkylation response protein AidB-like acyl-CoA dehydrogenase
VDFRLTDEQRALRAGMRELLDKRFPRERMRAALDASADRTPLDRALWRELGEAGLFSMGQDGMGPAEAVLVFAEAGRALLPGPLVATHLAAGVVPGAAAGTAIVAGCDGALVDHLADADAVLLIGEHTVGVCEPSTLAGEALRSVDPLTPLHRVRTTSGSTAANASHVWRQAVLLTAAEQSGSAARTVELAVAHAAERRQFGRPIGAFQAVKHLCADMLVRAEMARTAVYAAAVTGDYAEIAAAKLLADEAAVGNSRDCLQVFGGMGFTWEADVHLHLKRAWVRAERFAPRAAVEEGLAAALAASIDE